MCPNIFLIWRFENCLFPKPFHNPSPRSLLILTQHLLIRLIPSLMPSKNPSVVPSLIPSQNLRVVHDIVQSNMSMIILKWNISTILLDYLIHFHYLLITKQSIYWIILLIFLLLIFLIIFSIVSIALNPCCWILSTSKEHLYRQLTYFLGIKKIVILATKTGSVKSQEFKLIYQSLLQISLVSLKTLSFLVMILMSLVMICQQKWIFSTLVQCMIIDLMIQMFSQTMQSILIKIKITTIVRSQFDSGTDSTVTNLLICLHDYKQYNAKFKCPVKLTGAVGRLQRIFILLEKTSYICLPYNFQISCSLLFLFTSSFCYSYQSSRYSQDLQRLA